jgi:Protein of unknown function (DUF1566)
MEKQISSTLVNHSLKGTKMNHKTIALKLSALVLSGLLVSGMAWGAGSQKSGSRYVIQGDTVYDKKSDLTWARCSVGQRWKEGAGCVGVVKEYTFDQAQSQGSGEWRVPSKDELVTLIDHGKADAKQKPSIDKEAFPDMDVTKLAYWSSTLEGASTGWNVYFAGDHVSYYGPRSNTGAVRLVRGGQ